MKYTQEQLDDYLVFACEIGHIEIIKLLLDKGANVDAWEGYALKYACSNGHVELAELLLNNGAEVHANNVLIWAYYYGHFEIIKLLKEHMKKRGA